ncbi:MAG: hypothetical protein GHCLOJNM_00376 [bacterium]|nr:hypothetical protein [bacterium]
MRFSKTRRILLFSRKRESIRYADCKWTIGGTALCFLTLGFAASCWSEQFAPPDAFEDNSGIAYYGSATAWDRRVFERADGSQYGRLGQKALLHVLDGKPEEAVRLCEELIAKDPQDLESRFILVLARAQLKEISRALEALQHALDAGLPFERFQAGPRELFDPLYRTEKFRELAARHGRALIHGPMLGAVTENSAKFWVRTATECEVQVIASTSPGFESIIPSEKNRTSAERDYTAVVSLCGVEPATQYHYRVHLNGKPARGSETHLFRTAPTAGSKVRFDVAFGGGANYCPTHERMWTTILRRKPSAFLFLGDNVYIDLPEEAGPFHDYTYYRRQSRPEYRELIASTPIHAIWDDHDSATNDSWLGPFREKPSWKPSMWRLFENNWNNPSFGSPEWPGCWHRFPVGDVEFFMLDGRSYRTHPEAPERAMLGPVQKQWLKEGLKSSTATFKVIASPVPWSFEAKESLDTWNGYREEREELFAFLHENRIEGVILLSADRHRSDAWRIERADGYPLYEFESSRLTNEHTHNLVPGALFGYNETCSFGLLSFDTLQADPEVTYRIVGIDDEVKRSLTVRRSNLAY